MQRVLNITEQLPEYQSEMERNKLNLQTVLFRPLRSHQCSSEWFENWDMSTAQRAINTSHTDKQWHILFLNIYIWLDFRKGYRQFTSPVSRVPPSQIFQFPSSYKNRNCLNIRTSLDILDIIHPTK